MFGSADPGLVLTLQEDQPDGLNLRWIDLENALCEFSKYVRILEGQTKVPRLYNRF